MHARALSLFSLMILLASGEPAFSEVPPGKLVMLDLDKVSTVTSKSEPDNWHLSFREVINTGINGLHYRHWTGTGGGYTKEEWTAEAHEYGLWVAGGCGADHPNETVVGEAADLAAWGVDFIQLDEPMGFGMTRQHYINIKNAVNAVNASCPVIITDVFYNDTIGSWPETDGVAQEVYADIWYQYIDAAVAYKNAHPSQSVFMWVWLPVRAFYPTDPCSSLPDSKFDLWFNDSFDKVGKVLLFIFQARDGGGDVCSYASNWPARAATISAKTSGYRVALPEWSGFAASGTTDGSPSLSVNVSSAGAGLDPGSVKAFYSVDGGTTWTAWADVACTGSHGTTGTETITAHNVPFNQVSTDLNKIRFKITDTYSGNYYRSARTDKMTYNVEIPAISADPIDAGQGGTADAAADAPDASDLVTGGDGGVPASGSGNLSGGCGCDAAHGRGASGLPSQLLLLAAVALALLLARRRSANHR